MLSCRDLCYNMCSVSSDVTRSVREGDAALSLLLVASAYWHGRADGMQAEKSMGYEATILRYDASP